MSILTSKIKLIIDEAHTMKHSYFFNSPGNASARRDYERKHSHEKIEWKDGKDNYSAEFVVKCSCSNVYAMGYYFKNGKRTNLTAIKSSYKRLTDAENSAIMSNS